MTIQEIKGRYADALAFINWVEEQTPGNQTSEWFGRIMSFKTLAYERLLNDIESYLSNS